MIYGECVVQHIQLQYEPFRNAILDISQPYALDATAKVIPVSREVTDVKWGKLKDLESIS